MSRDTPLNFVIMYMYVHVRIYVQTHALRWPSDSGLLILYGSLIAYWLVRSRSAGLPVIVIVDGHFSSRVEASQL